MKAHVIEKYGFPEELRLKELSEPVPSAGEVLVEIHATAINDYDWSMVRGKPYLYRLLFGLIKPKNRIIGMELSGIIKALGSGVTNLKVGDEVFGDISAYGFGTYAEYLCIREEALIRKSDKMSFEEAASIPHASLLAWQALEDIARLQANQKVLINGAGGGVGTFALQLAKLKNCEVTGVDNQHKLQMMESLGFDHLIDYEKEDFTRNGEQYDLILDCKTNRSPSSYLRSLREGGCYVTVGGVLGRLVQMLFVANFISLFSKKKLRILALKPNKDLGLINELFEAGKLQCVIDGPHPFEDAPTLLRYFGEGKHKGKIVLRVK